MQVEIIGLDDQIARCRVTDGNRSIDFSVSSSMEAHQQLKHMLQNAFNALAHARAKERMDEFTRRAHEHRS